MKSDPVLGAQKNVWNVSINAAPT